MTSTFDLALSYTYEGNCLILLNISQEWICVYHEKTGQDSINLLNNRSQSNLRKLIYTAYPNIETDQICWAFSNLLSTTLYSLNKKVGKFTNSQPHTFKFLSCKHETNKKMNIFMVQNLLKCISFFLCSLTYDEKLTDGRFWT